MSKEIATRRVSEVIRVSASLAYASGYDWCQSGAVQLGRITHSTQFLPNRLLRLRGNRGGRCQRPLSSHSFPPIRSLPAPSPPLPCHPSPDFPSPESLSVPSPIHYDRILSTNAVNQRSSTNPKTNSHETYPEFLHHRPH